MITHADAKSVTWSVTYYQAIPNKKEISAQYCSIHVLGTFIGDVNKQLHFGAITNHGIKLDKFTFNSRTNNGIYLMVGTLRARGQFKNIPWEDHIHYYVYKLSEYGLTKGIWSSGDCKGYLIGKVVNKQIG